MQYPYLIADRQAGILDSLQRSRSLLAATSGRSSWSTSPTRRSFSAAFSCCVGLIFTLPLGQVMLAVTYLSLVGTSPPETLPVLTERPLFSAWEEDL